MKKFLCMLLALLLVGSLMACGDKTPDDPVDPDPNPGQVTTNPSDNTVFSGNVTESVVRSYKVAPESNFTYAEVAGGVRISGYTGADTIVVIPEKINGKDVVSIDALIFGNDSKVRGVYVPSTVKALIGTFTNNVVLEVVICEGVESIGANVFNNCSSLHTVILGRTISEIGDSAFFNCAKLKELRIPNTLTEIDKKHESTVFFWCDSLTIKGEAGSYIETFCTEQGIKFQAN